MKRSHKQNTVSIKHDESNKQNTIVNNESSTGNYQVINGYIGDEYKPMDLGTFMGAMEAYSRGLPMTDDEKNCLISQNVILDKGIVK